MPLLGGVLRDPGLHQLPYEGSRQWIVRLKTNCALAGVEGLEFVLVRSHGPVDCAVIRGGAKTRDTFSVQSEGGELADLAESD